MLWRGALVQNQEVRSITSGTSKAGKRFLTLKVEDDQGNDNELTISGDMVGVVESLQLVKGDVIDLHVTVVSGYRDGRSYAYSTLTNMQNPIVIKGNAYQGYSDISAM